MIPSRRPISDAPRAPSPSARTRRRGRAVGRPRGSGAVWPARAGDAVARARRTRRPRPSKLASPRRGRGPHPRGRVVGHLGAVAPVLPGQLLRGAVVVDHELGLRVDRVLAVGERELEQLRLGDRLGGARLDAQVAVDAPQVVDLVDEAVALAGRAPGSSGRCRRRARRCTWPGTRRRTARSRCTSPCRPRTG